MRQLRPISALKSGSVRARDGDIGKVEQMYFDDESWHVRYFVVRTGSWLAGREVLIAPRSVTGVAEDGKLTTDLTREQIENSPPVESERPVSRHYEAEFHRHYGWHPYWPLGAPFGGPLTPAAPPPVQDPFEGTLTAPDNPHLRASDEVRGYVVHARDGEFGEIDDFIVDDQDWKVRYVVLDTRRWLPGKKVLLAPAWIDAIDWGARHVVVDLQSETIRSAPSYDPAQLITREYEVRLYGHYGRQLDDER